MITKEEDNNFSENMCILFFYLAGITMVFMIINYAYNDGRWFIWVRNFVTSMALLLGMYINFTRLIQKDKKR